MNRVKSGIVSGAIDDIESRYLRSLGEAAKLGELTEQLWFE